MTFQHLNVAHRMLKRQLGLAKDGGPATPGGGPGNGGPPGSGGDPDPGNGPDPSNGPVFTQPSSSLSFPTKPTQPNNDKPPPQSDSRPPPATTSSQPPAAVTTTSTTATPDATTTSSSSAPPSTIAVPTTSSRSTVIVTAPAFVATSSFGTVSLPSITPVDPTSTPSASTTPSATSGVSVGKVVGGIAGGLVGIAIIGFLVSFILRRLRKRSHRNSFIDDDFRQSQFITDNNDPLGTPGMAQRTHNIAPSIGSGPGMAGQGAYHQSNTAAYGADDGYNAPAPTAYGGAGYGATGYGAAAAGMGAAGGALHERPRYTYGQANDDEGSETAHGAYSSQPQVQAPYNPEAYGSYAAYAGAPAGYQEATREYQAHPQQGGYAQGGYHEQQYGGGHYGVAVADPGPATASHAGAHSTSPSPRDPSALSGTRGPNTRSVVQDDDVYGGI